MSKKPKQSRHRVPTLTFRSDPITPDYQDEIDRSISKLELRYKKAQKALEAAEARAERARLQAESLTEKQAKAQLVAANRLANERRLSEFIETIKQAAKRARVAESRAHLERQRLQVEARRNEETRRRREEAKQLRERARLISQARSSLSLREAEVDERRRELREIEKLMIPDFLSGGRDSRRRLVRLESAAIEVPLGGTNRGPIKHHQGRF